MPVLATADRARGGRRRAPASTPPSQAVAVPFPDLAPADLVAWRLGMAQVAPFVASLPEAARRQRRSPRPRAPRPRTPSRSSAA